MLSGKLARYANCVQQYSDITHYMEFKNKNVQIKGHVPLDFGKLILAKFSALSRYNYVRVRIMALQENNTAYPFVCPSMMSTNGNK